MALLWLEGSPWCPAIAPWVLLTLLCLLPSRATSANPTWARQMAVGADQVCFPPVHGGDDAPVAPAQPVCIDRLSLGTARDAGHFCGGHFAARLPAAAFCTGGGCLIEVDAHRKQSGHVANANLLSEDTLPLFPYGESWVYGCALRSYDSPVQTIVLTRPVPVQTTAHTKNNSTPHHAMQPHVTHRCHSTSPAASPAGPTRRRSTGFCAISDSPGHNTIHKMVGNSSADRMQRAAPRSQF